MDKITARKKAGVIRNNICGMEAISRKICDKILKDCDFINSDVVLAYIATKNEIDLTQIIDYCMRNNKMVAVPKVTDTKKCTMEFVIIKSLDELKSGYMGIYEPINDIYTNFYDNANIYMILPGLAFGKNGIRAGYGKGYYDRYIEKGFTGIKTGVAIDEAVFEYIDGDLHDILWDKLITENNIYVRNR